MIIVKGKPVRHLLYAIYRKLYLYFYWKIPTLLPAIRIPYTIEFELTNHCNLSCVHCHRKIMKRQLGYMDFDLFKKAVDEISAFPIAFIRIVGQGESSMHPQFKEMMEYLAAKKVKVEFATNGYIFEKYTFDEILSWNIDILGISVDGIDEKSYSQIRINGDYNRLMKDVTGFYNYRKSKKKKYPLIKIRNVIFPSYTKKTIKAFNNTWLPISDYITYNTYWPLECKESFSEYERCFAIFFDAHIRWNGLVPLCDNQFIYGKNEWIGDLHQFSMRKIWSSERLRKVRLLHQKKNIQEVSGCEFCFNIHQKDLIRNNYRNANASRNRMVNKMNRVVNVT